MENIKSVLFASSPVICFMFLIQSACPYKMFQKRIPNGDSIPNPCNSGVLWNGVGHTSSMGGGVRNPFGKDFQQVGKVWTEVLCLKDSDGDGLTNGEELGDPSCTWTEGNTPTITTGLSHPGICEDLGSSDCKARNSWLNCDADKFECGAIYEEDVKSIIVTLPKDNLRTQETSYLCMRFQFPTDGDYHIIAEEPIIDNDNVLHHILLFGCDDVEGLLIRYKCNMFPGDLCKDILSVWSIGSPGNCGSPRAGFRIGSKGYKYGAIQVHYNNPQKILYKDGSGLKLYYTPRLRPHDAGILAIGQLYLEIPPQQSAYQVTASCSPECSSILLNSDVFIIKGLNHMHYLGKSERVEIYRNQQLLTEITSEANYRYDDPKATVYDTPAIVKPGDELRATCVFQSLHTDTITYFGEDTSAEMCSAFLTYYPKQNLTSNICLSWKSLPYCMIYGEYRSLFMELNRCNLTTFNLDFMFKRFLKVSASCNDNTCHSTCLSAVKEYLSDPCLQGDLGDYVKYMAYRYDPYKADIYFKVIEPCLALLKTCTTCTTEESQTETDKGITSLNTDKGSTIFTPTTDNLTSKFQTKTDKGMTSFITDKGSTRFTSTTDNGTIFAGGKLFHGVCLTISLITLCLFFSLF